MGHQPFRIYKFWKPFYCDLISGMEESPSGFQRAHATYIIKQKLKISTANKISKKKCWRIQGCLSDEKSRPNFRPPLPNLLPLLQKDNNTHLILKKKLNCQSSISRQGKDLRNQNK
jgi:hypothetical protein